ncbi:hypothetical protein EMIT0215P_10399 [Pseudomonas serboccidentalis]
MRGILAQKHALSPDPVGVSRLAKALCQTALMLDTGVFASKLAPTNFPVATKTLNAFAPCRSEPAREGGLPANDNPRAAQAKNKE